MPEIMVSAMLEIFELIRSGQAAFVLPGVEQVLSRKLLSFAEWARHNAAAFIG